jgi:hypothetical protein
MGKKEKKNKQKQKQQNQVAPKKSVVTQGTITEANALMEEAKSTLTSIPENEVNVAEIEASYVTDGSVSSADVEKCISELRKSLKVLNSTQQRYEELKSQLKEDQDKWESEKIEEQKKLNDNKKTARCCLPDQRNTQRAGFITPQSPAHTQTERTSPRQPIHPPFPPWHSSEKKRMTLTKCQSLAALVQKRPVREPFFFP